MPLNIPNLITWLRILLIPVFVAVFYFPNETLNPQLKNLLATLVFLLASATDWLDGYLARNWISSPHSVLSLTPWQTN